MAADPFDDLLELENDFYQEGYEAGVADSSYAGLIEGKVFGIEKGYEKGLELGRLHGRAMIWLQRFEKFDASQSCSNTNHNSELSNSSTSSPFSMQISHHLKPVPDNTRLRKHIEFLLSITETKTIPKDNSDDSVADVDDRIAKARARAKIIANVLGEPLNPVSGNNTGIEDATGLSARH